MAVQPLDLLAAACASKLLKADKLMQEGRVAEALHPRADDTAFGRLPLCSSARRGDLNVRLRDGDLDGWAGGPFLRLTQRIEHHEPWLTLHGLRLIFEKNVD